MYRWKPRVNWKHHNNTNGNNNNVQSYIRNLCLNNYFNAHTITLGFTHPLLILWISWIPTRGWNISSGRRWPSHWWSRFPMVRRGAISRRGSSEGARSRGRTLKDKVIITNTLSTCTVSGFRSICIDLLWKVSGNIYSDTKCRLTLILAP